MAERGAGGYTVELAGCVRVSARQARLDVREVYGVCGLEEGRVCGSKGASLVCRGLR